LVITTLGIAWVSDKGRTKPQLIDELVKMSQRVAELEVLAAQQKRGAITGQEVQGYAEAIIETVREPLVVLDKHLKVLSGQPQFIRHIQGNPRRDSGAVSL
jgi:hypothetical protein